MINILKNKVEIVFSYTNLNNTYNDDYVKINDTLKPITYKKNHKGFFFVVVDSIDFTITDNFVKGTDKKIGTFKGYLNDVLYYTQPIKTDFICNHK